MDHKQATGSGLSLWLLGLAMVSLIAVCLWHNHSFFHDDTYITLRYASHLAAGFGPVWNKQGPRVEGFTSPLHMLFIAALRTTGIPLTMAARVVNVASHLSLLVYLFFYLRRSVGYLGAQLGVTLVGASWMFIIWDLGGLDAVLYATLATIGVLVATSGVYADQARQRRLLVLGSFILTFATLARPEGSLLLAGCWILVLVVPGIKVVSRLGSLAAGIGVAAVILIPVEIFRWTYFHALAPNTMYAKIGGITQQTLILLGIKYLVKFAFAPPYLGVLAPVAVVYSWFKKRSQGSHAAIWLFIGLSALFVVVSGGDHMVAFRFCLTMYALLATVLILALAQNGLLSQPFLGPAISIVFVLALALQIWTPILNPRKTDPAARIGKIIGVYIESHWPAGSTIALNTAGSTPFYADDMQYIDMLGLNDAQIARRKNIPKQGPWTHLVGHLKGDGASVLARKPDFIILGPAEGTTPQLRSKVYFIGDYEIGISPVFQQEYEPCTANASASVVLTYFERRDLGYPCHAEHSSP